MVHYLWLLFKQHDRLHNILKEKNCNKISVVTRRKFEHWYHVKVQHRNGLLTKVLDDACRLKYYTFWYNFQRNNSLLVS